MGVAEGLGGEVARGEAAGVTVQVWRRCTWTACGGGGSVGQEGARQWLRGADNDTGGAPAVSASWRREVVEARPERWCTRRPTTLVAGGGIRTPGWSKKEGLPVSAPNTLFQQQASFFPAS